LKFHAGSLFGDWLPEALPTLRTISPASADIKDANMIPSFENSRNWAEVKERPDMNRDMVKPIPPNIPTPTTWDQFTPEGKGALSVLDAR
jgi:hypothetical protein